MKLTWLGHGGWSIAVADQVVLLDPFLDDCPTAVCKAADVAADVVLLSHGHFDHVADAAAIVKRTGACLIATPEITGWFQKHHGVEKTIDMNIGGTVKLPFGSVKMTPAWHSSQLPDGSYGGNPVGFIVQAEGKRVYFACDTALFSDMRLIGAGGLDAAVVPIGDHYTMGPEDAVQAIKLLQPRQAVPAHYNTWPPIAQDAAAWAEQIRVQTTAEPCIVEPGGVIEV